jgi:predicted DNA-binding WGR domain protein
LRHKGRVGTRGRRKASVFDNQMQAEELIQLQIEHSLLFISHLAIK